MRKDRIEIAGQRLVHQAAAHRDREHEKQREAAGERQCYRQSRALIQPPQRRRPGIVLIGLYPHLRHRLRHVEREFVRRGILAGIQARAAVVAQIGKVMRIGLVELQPAGHCREHRAKPLAIAAGVADLHDPRDFGLTRRQRARQAHAVA